MSMEGSGIRRICNIVFSLLILVLLVSNLSLSIDEARKRPSVTGKVVDEDGKPLSGANVTLIFFDRYRRYVAKTVKTDSNGRFHASVDKEWSYLVYVTYDDKETPGVDYVPERWRTWLSSGSTASRDFVLRKGASIYLEGDLRYVKTNKIATSCEITVIELEGEGGSYWTGPVRDYGNDSDVARFLGFDGRLAVVPAGAKVKIRVKAHFPDGYSHSFTLTGETGYFKLSQGELLRVDVREQNLLKNIEYVSNILNSGFTLLDDCRFVGFLVEAEKKDLLNAHEACREALIFLGKKLFDQSFAKIRSAYILATRAEAILRRLVDSSLQSLLPSLLLFVFLSLASAYLLSERLYLEMSAGDRKLMVPCNLILDTTLYMLFVILFYYVFPGCRLIPKNMFVAMVLLTFLAGKVAWLLFNRTMRREKSEDRQIQLKSAIAIAFSLGTRNLRRRRVRTLINIMSITILVFGFITLTSISPEYGLSKTKLKPSIPVDCMMIKDRPEDEPPSSFVSLPRSFIDWLEKCPNVTLVSPKAENTPISPSNPLGYIYSKAGMKIEVLGILGIIPSREANITGVNKIVEEGDYLEDEDLEGVLLSSSMKGWLKVNVGDKIYGFGREFIIRGFFNDEALKRMVDVNGMPFIPHCMGGEPVPVPCYPHNVIIMNYETALKMPKVSISRVVVQLNDTRSYEALARLVAFTYEYKIYVSHPGSLTLYSLRHYVEARGVMLMLPLLALVTMNIGLSMYASVNERRNEIATLSSLGLNPTHIAALFVAEALIVGFIGGGLGYILGLSGYRVASMLGGLYVREKASAEWGVISTFLSIFTAALASLIPALQSSTVVTPSLLRRWRLRRSQGTSDMDKPLVFDLPIKLMTRELDSFMTFMIRKLQYMHAQVVKTVDHSEGEVTRRIKFLYALPEGGWTENEIIIQPEGKEYALKLICSLLESSSRAVKPMEAIRITVSSVRKLILEWSATAYKVLSPYDPYMSRFYNIVNTFSPSTLYIMSTRADIYDELDKLREALISRGLRPPKFAVSYIDLQNLDQALKTVENLVSKVDIVCLSGDDVTLSTVLAIEAARQNKTVCYVMENRPVEERIKEPFKELEVRTVFLGK